MIESPNRPEPFELRAYQHAAHRAIREAWSRDPDLGALVVMATGTGKTATALSLAVEDYLRRGLRVVWLAHREELLTQPQRTVARCWPEYDAHTGIVQSARNQVSARRVFASVATLAASPHRVDEILSH